MLLFVAFVAIIPTTIEPFCLDLMATSLSLSGFTLFAHALHAQNLTTSSRHRLTFLAPPDTALINTPLDNDTLHGHIIATGALPYQSLLTLPPNTVLPTLHNASTLVVGTDGKRVSLNDVLVVVPNLYLDGSCAVHGVDGPLVPVASPIDDATNPRSTQLSHFHQSPYGFSKHDRVINRRRFPGMKLVIPMKQDPEHP